MSLVCNHLVLGWMFYVIRLYNCNFAYFHHPWQTISRHKQVDIFLIKAIIEGEFWHTLVADWLSAPSETITRTPKQINPLEWDDSQSSVNLFFSFFSESLCWKFGIFFFSYTVIRFFETFNQFNSLTPKWPINHCLVAPKIALTTHD
jgi:hypothetical protein